MASKADSNANNAPEGRRPKRRLIRRPRVGKTSIARASYSFGCLGHPPVSKAKPPTFLGKVGGFVRPGRLISVALVVDDRAVFTVPLGLIEGIVSQSKQGLVAGRIPHQHNTDADRGRNLAGLGQNAFV